MTDDDPATDDIDAIALLDEPVRRKLYDWVVRQGRPIGRDEASAGAGVSRALTAFHLDRLAKAGLLATEFRRLSGKTGPGAGRPSKLYMRSDRDIRVSLPERRYDIAAELMADALEDASGPPSRSLQDAAHRMGEEVGSAAKDAAGPRPTRARRHDALVQTLEERGYEPVEGGGTLRLRNCPFHALVDDHRDLVCGMNLALAEGILDGLGEERISAHLDRQPGLCCVAFDLE